MKTRHAADPLYVFTISVLCCIACAVPLCAAEEFPSGEPPPAGDRRAVFVSDLHMGVGIEQESSDPDSPATWDPTEDFRWHDEFRAFLREMNVAGGGKVDLVLLGDFLELWQSPRDDCDHSEISKDLGCTETEAVRRATRVVQQHRSLFEDLVWFGGQDDNRVVIVPGNHDIALAYQGVRDVVMDALSRHPHTRIATEGYWMSADGRIFAEHGQQIGHDPNKYPDYPSRDPFIEKGGVTYLRQPWGEQLVQEFYNRYEGGEYRWAVIDNLSEKVKGIGYGLRAGGVLKEGTKAVGRFARFALTQTSWRQTGQILGEDNIPIWDLEAIDKDPLRFFAESFPADQPLRAALEAEMSETGDPEDIGPLDEAEIREICNLRWAFVVADRKKAEDHRSGITPCPDTGELGAIAEGASAWLFRGAKDKRFQRHLAKMRDSVPANGRPTTSFDLFVFGHTHKEESHYRPFAPDAEWQPEVFNDGAWQRRAAPEVFCTIAKLKHVDKDEAIKVLQPEDLPACYPFVTVVNKAGENLDVQLRYWVQGEGETGSVQGSCTVAPDVDPECALR